MPWESFKKFVQYEASSGIFLFIAAIIAMILDNSPWHVFYQGLLNTHFGVHLGPAQFGKPLLLWINDGLMAIFFLLVGLEIKREMVSGELSSFRQAVLPGIAAVGGMLIPALVYLLFNGHQRNLLAGWAIPTATDIAFSLGILALLNRRIPSSIKIFLTALAIFDDLGAIIIIAIFYTSHIAHVMLVAAFIVIVALFCLNKFRVQRRAPYIILGIILWFCVLKSGVHATLAGIVLAWAIPVRSRDGRPIRMLERWEHGLHPWVAYLILPIFAFANAGIRFADMHFADLWHSITAGCALGLFFGKQIGITLFVWLAVRLGWAQLPTDIKIRGVYGVSLVAGIGFTMSLFIGSLAFAGSGELMMARVRLGVILGSLASGLVGYFWLKRVYRDNIRI